MIAPFWSDVDTRARGGVYYKVLPNALIVIWQDVGYFDQNSSKGNTFQLIISDGTSDLLPFGNNVGFFYQDLQWTAGIGSGGVNGFGGAPALVGVNAGDNQKYSLLGSYDKADTSFYPKVDTANGIAQLMGQHTFLNVCHPGNQKPGIMGYKLGDTIGVCIGDTLKETLRFLAPEMDQKTYVSLTSGSFTGFQLLQTTSAQMATATIEIVGSSANMGFHNLSFKVFDNGSPSHSIAIDIVVQIDSLTTLLQVFGDTSICAYDTTLLSVPNGYESVLWNTYETNRQIEVIPGVYTVSVSENNCEESLQHTVQGYLPSAHVTGPKFICLPNTVTYNAEPNLDGYLWSTTDTTDTIGLSQGGVYSLTVTNRGCVNESKFELEDSVYVNIQSSNPVSCNGDSVTLSVPNEYDAILWSTGDTAHFIRVPAGSYSVTVEVNSMSGMSCQASDSITIDVYNFNPVSVSGNPSVCGDESNTWLVNGNYDSYLWDNDATTFSTIYQTPGNHSVTVTKATCSDSVNFQYVSIPNPEVTINGELFYCDNVDSAQLVAVGTPWDSLIWNTGDVTDTIYTGFGWKNVTVFKDGCYSVAWHPVNELINGVDVHGITQICPGQATRLEVEFGFDLYTWNTGAIGFSTLVNAPGQYWCVVNLDTCSATTDTVTVNLISADSAQIFGDTVMCDTAGGQLYVDLNFNQFIWNTGETSPSIFYSTTGMYSVTVEDENFCVTSDSVFIEQKPRPTVNIVGDTHYCFNDSAELSVSSFEQYFWVNGETTPSIKARAGTYGITVVDSNGCTAVDNGFIVTQSAPEAVILYDTIVCGGDSLWVYTSLSSADSVLWNNEIANDSAWVETGEVQLMVVDRFGCRADSVLEMQTLPTPVAGVDIDPESQSASYFPIAFRDGSALNGAVIDSWYWNWNDSISSTQMDTTFTFLTGVALEITHALITDLGCSDTIRVPYLITDEIIKVNVITPNGDGVNDYLVFPNIQKYPENVVRIFNRWGVEVAYFPTYRNTWDAYGLPDGVYYYVIELNHQDAAPIKGSVTVIRN